MKWTVAFVVLIVLGGVVYVRFAPADPARWHVRAYASGMGHIDRRGGHLWRGAGGEEAFARLDEIIRATPRTEVLTGSRAEKMITYVTRSKVFGFPDYTTLGVYDGLSEDGDLRYVEINSRQRFGLDDLGVNRARIERWLDALWQVG